MITHIDMAWTTSTLLLLLTSNVLALGVHDDRPKQTATADDGFDLMGWTPMPTQMPAFVGSHELRKRATEDPPNPTCGYMLGLEEYSFTCYSGKYCGARTDYSVLGCCNTYFSTGGEYSLSGCTYQTICYDATDARSLASTELTNSRALICTEAGYPYCMQYLFTDVSYTIFGCNTGSNVVISMALSTDSTAPSTSINLRSTGVRPTPTATGPASDDDGTTTTDEGARNNGTTPSPAPAKSNNTPAIVGGVVGGIALILIAAGACFFFFLRHKRQQQAAAVAAGSTPAMGQNQRPQSGAGKAPETFVSPLSPQQNPPPQYYQPGPQSPGPQPMMSPPPQPMMTPPPQTGSPGPMPPMAAMAPYPTNNNTAFAAPGPSPMMGAMPDYSRPQSQVSPNLIPSSPPMGVQEMPSRVASPTTAMPAVPEAPGQTAAAAIPPSHASVSSVSEAHGQPINPPPQQTYVYQAYNPNAPSSPPPVGQNPTGQNSMGYQSGPTPQWERHEMP